MHLIDRLAIKIGSGAKSLLNVNEEKEQIIIYGAINFLQVVFAILWVIIFGMLFGVFLEALLFSVVVSILRKYSGGVHASSSNRCIIIGTFAATIAGILSNSILDKFSISTIMTINLAFIIFALIIVIKNAPVDSINKPITNIKLKRQFKKKSTSVIFIFFTINLILFLLGESYLESHYIKFIVCISLALAWQSITLTKIGISLLNKVDFLLKNIIDFGLK